MIQAHALDAWTRTSSRTSHAYGYLLLLGGFAAPLFLWLAGLGVALWCGLAAAAVAMATPIVRNATWVDHIPLWTQWYLRPFGDHTTFTMLPWAGFVFAGAAYGSFLASSKDFQSERQIVAGLGVAG